MSNNTLPVTSSRWPTHALWLGPLLTLAGALSYFLYFFQFPILRDFPLVNLPVVVLGFLFTSAGCWQVFRTRGRWLRKALASLSFLFSLALAGLFSFYIFILSYQVPEPAAAPELHAAAPNFTLADQNGKQVQLTDFLGNKVLLVFYRGHW